ncbi:high molecular weight subunit PW212-like protein [Pyrrhoderma noxium]|uniref:High molecular weight subunit PW212-like protein n=1 Tax=Pyrrhoderma noxium TaxID=2282107 RepID=A0A286UCZ1_9AGAM|nr:high molecular weight subunit PW212-like protein [Pyrrhoderma noxium]
MPRRGATRGVICKGDHTYECDKCNTIRRVWSYKNEIVRDVIEFIKINNENTREWGFYCTNDPSKGTAVPPFMRVHTNPNFGQLYIPDHQHAKSSSLKCKSATIQYPGESKKWKLQINLEVEYNKAPTSAGYPTMIPTSTAIPASAGLPTSAGLPASATFPASTAIPATFPTSAGYPAMIPTLARFPASNGLPASAGYPTQLMMGNGINKTKI